MLRCGKAKRTEEDSVHSSSTKRNLVLFSSSQFISIKQTLNIKFCYYQKPYLLYDSERTKKKNLKGRKANCLANGHLYLYHVVKISVGLVSTLQVFSKQVQILALQNSTDIHRAECGNTVLSAKTS